MVALEQAKWVFADVDGEIVDRYFDYHMCFDVIKPKETTLYISAYSQYAVYINGHFVDCGQYADYEDWKVYDTLSIASFLKEGTNELLIQQYVQGKDFFTARKQKPGVIFSIVSGGEILAKSDNSCKARENIRYLSNQEFITAQLGFNFEYDATIELSEFAPCVEVDKEKKLYPRPIKKLKIGPLLEGKLITQGCFLDTNPNLKKAQRCQYSYMSFCEKKSMFSGNKWLLPLDKRADGAYFIFDLGGECAGLLSFDVEVPEACEILISYGEHLDDLRVRSSVGERNFTFRYLAKKGRNTFFYPFQRLGVRYLQVMIYEQEGVIYHVGLCCTNYPLVYKPMSVTDGLHKEIWKTARKTLELCMHEHYEDCPWREQALYGMDSRIQMLCGYYAFEEMEFPKAALRLMARTLGEDGLLEMCPPGRAYVNIPSFSVIFIRQVMEYVEYSKDKDFVREMFPVLNKMVRGFEQRIDGSGLIPQYENKWNFYEWKENLDDIDGLEGTNIDKGVVYDCLLNGLIADAFQCFAVVCKEAGYDGAEHYVELHRRLCKATEVAFWREESGGYASYLTDKEPSHELAQSIMLYAGAVPSHKQQKIVELIKGKELVPCTLSMTIFSYEALLKVSKENYEFVIHDIEEQWTKMLRSNTDTFWETQKGADDFDYAGSLCHGWAAVPIYIFAHYGK